MKIQKQAAFTLIELLVTVSIIGILAAMAVINVVEYKKRAYDAGAIALNAAVRQAIEVYYVDFADHEQVNNSGLFHGSVSNLISEIGYTDAGLPSGTDFSSSADSIALLISTPTGTVGEICVATQHLKGSKIFRFYNGNMSTKNAVNESAGFTSTACTDLVTGGSTTAFYRQD